MAGFEFDEELLDFIIHEKEKEESFNIEDFKHLSETAHFPTPHELERITRKGEIYLGAEFDETGEFINHATIPAKDLTVHQITYGVSGSGKTEKMKFLLCTLMLQKDIAKILNLDVKIYDSIIIDNLGNFAKFGEPTLQQTKEFLKIYLKSGWHPDYLRSLGLSWVRKYMPSANKKISLWKPSRVVPNLKSARHFINYLEQLGVDTAGVIGIIYKSLNQMEFFNNDFSDKCFRFDEFYNLLKIERDKLINLSGIFQEGNIDKYDDLKKLWEQIATLDKIISPLEILDKEYCGVFDTPDFEDGKIIIQDCSKTTDRWLFHSTLLSYYYFKFAKKTENLQGIKQMISTDEYNDILDDKDLVNSKDYEERREGFLANFTRSLFLRLVREGRNYGTPVNIATQNPSQLLIKEGKKFSSIQNVWIGYLGREVARLKERKTGEGSLGSNMQTILDESEEDGWISKKGTGKWLLESGGKIRRIQTFMSFYD